LAGRHGRPTLPPIWLVCFGALVLAMLGSLRIYAPRLRLEMLEMLRVIPAATAIAGMIVVGARVLIDDAHTDATAAVRLWFFSSVCLLAARGGLLIAETRARKTGAAGRRALVVGAGSVGRLTARRLLTHPEWGLVPVGFLDKDPLPTNSEPIDVLGTSWDFDQVVAAHGIEHIVFAFSTAPHDVFLRLLKRCDELDLGISIVPRLFERHPGRVSIEHIGGLPLVTLQSVRPHSIQFAFKYYIDRVVAASVILVVSPILLLTAAAVWLSMGRPIFYTQSRVGRDGRRFKMYKFRSMRIGEAGTTDESSSSEVAPGGVEGDDRRTRVGMFLRRTALDELPQLANVLVGQMSLVGPRPERPEFADHFQSNISRYGERLRVKSGITGWAQVNGLRGKTSLSDRVELDNYYIENWSLWLDAKIVALTLREIVRSYGRVE
jgi:exopolysaccharide biosynthesis polyprenyl glycosylphosphotransferase